MVIDGAIVSGIEEVFELSIGDGILVNPERTDVNSLCVIAARRRFPRVLNVDSLVVHPFNLDTVYTKDEVSFRNVHHARRILRGSWHGWNFDQLLRESVPFPGECAERFLAEVLHFRQELVQPGCVQCRGFQHGTVPVGLQIERQY